MLLARTWMRELPMTLAICEIRGIGALFLNELLQGKGSCLMPWHHRHLQAVWGGCRSKTARRFCDGVGSPSPTVEEASAEPDGRARQLWRRAMEHKGAPAQLSHPRPDVGVKPRQLARGVAE